MYEIIFLSILAILWIVFATVQDLRKREIANWLNFSLIIFALGFRFFYSLFSSGNFGFFYQGLVGLAVFFLLGNFLYYSRMFAGGDAKLMIALGAILPFSETFSANLKLFVVFLFIFLFTGAVYSLITSLAFSLKNFKKFKKEFGKQFKLHTNLYNLIMFLAITLVLIGFFSNILLVYLGAILFFLPYLHLYAKAVDEACMIKKIKTRELTEGDWLYKDVKVGKKTIKANWDGLKKEEINTLRKKYKSILVRYGIPFSPVFLISFLILLYFWKTGLWNSLW
jgi:Flp pilus assembly protein protease CpaA